jgi:hypothetical protein
MTYRMPVIYSRNVKERDSSGVKIAIRKSVENIHRLKELNLLRTTLSNTSLHYYNNSHSRPLNASTNNLLQSTSISNLHQSKKLSKSPSKLMVQMNDLQ